MTTTASTQPQPAGTLDDYRKLAHDCVKKLQERYHWRANWHRRIFRASGILIILVSSGLPLLAAFSYPRKDVVVAIAGVVIAAITALRTFYRWDEVWAVLRRTHFDLAHAHNIWQVDFRRAEAAADPAERERLAYEATKALIERADKIRGDESERYFGSLSFPPQPA